MGKSLVPTFLCEVEVVNACACHLLTSHHRGLSVPMDVEQISICHTAQHIFPRHNYHLQKSQLTAEVSTNLWEET